MKFATGYLSMMLALHLVPHAAAAAGPALALDARGFQNVIVNAAVRSGDLRLRSAISSMVDTGFLRGAAFDAVSPYLGLASAGSGGIEREQAIAVARREVDLRHDHRPAGPAPSNYGVAARTNGAWLVNCSYVPSGSNSPYFIAVDINRAGEVTGFHESSRPPR